MPPFVVVEKKKKGRRNFKVKALLLLRRRRSCRRRRRYSVCHYNCRLGEELLLNNSYLSLSLLLLFLQGTRASSFLPSWPRVLTAAVAREGKRGTPPIFTCAGCLPSSFLLLLLRSWPHRRKENRDGSFRKRRRRRGSCLGPRVPKAITTTGEGSFAPPKWRLPLLNFGEERKRKEMP